ncbi:MAG: hypothetical protein M3495_15365 [Pseudomonadota bacterium]|nr:hypothetical protein [Gammaproteobacteria bacterium]MDQ3582889.1 hypothetical protein [Pseudomonadota bacterium]
MEDAHQAGEQQFDQIPWRGDFAFALVAQGESEGQRENDHAEHLAVVGERAEHAPRHVIEKGGERVCLGPHLDGRLGRSQLRPRPGPEEVRDQKPDGDGDQGVEEQEPHETQAHPFTELRVDEGMDDGAQDQGQGERAEQA